MSNSDIATTALNSATESISSGTSTTEPTIEPSSAFTEFVLRQIGCAKLRAQITVNQIEMAATALSAGFITPETALLVLHETGLKIEISS